MSYFGKSESTVGEDNMISKENDSITTIIIEEVDTLIISSPRTKPASRNGSKAKFNATEVRKLKAADGKLKAREMSSNKQTSQQQKDPAIRKSKANRISENKPDVKKKAPKPVEMFVGGGIRPTFQRKYYPLTPNRDAMERKEEKLENPKQCSENGGCGGPSPAIAVRKKPNILFANGETGETGDVGADTKESEKPANATGGGIPSNFQRKYYPILLTPKSSTELADIKEEKLRKPAQRDKTEQNVRKKDDKDGNEIALKESGKEKGHATTEEEAKNNKDRDETIAKPNDETFGKLRNTEKTASKLGKQDRDKSEALTSNDHDNKQVKQAPYVDNYDINDKKPRGEDEDGKAKREETALIKDREDRIMSPIRGSKTEHRHKKVSANYSEREKEIGRDLVDKSEVKNHDDKKNGHQESGKRESKGKNDKGPEKVHEKFSYDAETKEKGEMKVDKDEPNDETFGKLRNTEKTASKLGKQDRDKSEALTSNDHDNKQVKQAPYVDNYDINDKKPRGEDKDGKAKREETALIKDHEDRIMSPIRGSKTEHRHKKVSANDSEREEEIGRDLVDKSEKNHDDKKNGHRESGKRESKGKNDKGPEKVHEKFSHDAETKEKGEMKVDKDEPAAGKEEKKIFTTPINVPSRNTDPSVLRKKGEAHSHHHHSRTEKSSRQSDRHSKHDQKKTIRESHKSQGTRRSKEKPVQQKKTESVHASLDKKEIKDNQKFTSNEDENKTFEERPPKDREIRESSVQKDEGCKVEHQPNHKQERTEPPVLNGKSETRRPHHRHTRTMGSSKRSKSKQNIRRETVGHEIVVQHVANFFVRNGESVKATGQIESTDIALFDDALVFGEDVKTTHLVIKGKKFKIIINKANNIVHLEKRPQIEVPTVKGMQFTQTSMESPSPDAIFSSSTLLQRQYVPLQELSSKAIVFAQEPPTECKFNSANVVVSNREEVKSVNHSQISEADKLTATTETEKEKSPKEPASFSRDYIPLSRLSNKTT